MKKVAISYFALVLCISDAFADTFSDTQLTLSPTFLYFDYTEFSTTDNVLNSETGWLPGLEATIQHELSKDWFLGAHTTYYKGTVDYDGQTQTGVPHTTETNTRLLRLGAIIERVIGDNLNLFAGVQSHRWDRDIKDRNNVSGLEETYKWLEYSLGIHSDFKTTPNDNINLSASYLLIRNATINVDLNRFNRGSADLDIGDGTGARVNITWTHQHVNNRRYGFGLFFETWKFGRSNTEKTQGSQIITFVTEPRSETKNTGIKFNIEYMF